MKKPACLLKVRRHWGHFIFSHFLFLPPNFKNIKFNNLKHWFKLNFENVKFVTCSISCAISNWRFASCAPTVPRTHKICDIKNFWTKFCPNLTILVSLESWRRDLSKFGKTKLSRDPNFAKIQISILGLRIQNLDLS